MNYFEIVNSTQMITKNLPSFSYSEQLDKVRKNLSIFTKRVSHEVLAKNFQPLLSKSEMKIIADLQREQLKNLSKSLAKRNEMSMQRLRDPYIKSLLNDRKPSELVNETLEVSVPLETKRNFLTMWRLFVEKHPIFAFLILQLLDHYVVTPFWNLLDTFFVNPIISHLLTWIVQFINFP